MMRGHSGSPPADVTRPVLRSAIYLTLLTIVSCQPAEDRATEASDGYQFALVGDMPYYASPSAPLPPEFVAAQYAAVLREIDAVDVEFVVHVGDLNSSLVCADSVYTARFAEFEALRHPVFLTFGDNEWLECDNAGLDPMEQLETLREVFTQGDRSLGGSTLPLERQSGAPGFEKFRENVRWRFGDDLYVTLHVPGGNNNMGSEADPRAEFVERNRAVITWMRQSFALAREEGLQSVVIVMHANPGWDSFNRGEPRPAYAEFLAALRDEAGAFDGPVLLLHGDSHRFTVDKPFRDSATGEMTANLTRVETFGHPFMHWVLITVAADDLDRFSVQPMIVEAR